MTTATLPQTQAQAPALFRADAADTAPTRVTPGPHARFMASLIEEDQGTAIAGTGFCEEHFTSENVANDRWVTTTAWSAGVSSAFYVATGNPEIDCRVCGIVRAALPTLNSGAVAPTQGQVLDYRKTNVILDALRAETLTQATVLDYRAAILDTLQDRQNDPEAKFTYFPRDFDAHDGPTLPTPLSRDTIDEALDQMRHTTWENEWCAVCFEEFDTLLHAIAVIDRLLGVYGDRMYPL